jgi:hypothetical protein
MVTVIGIVSNSTSGIRILPRTMKDIIKSGEVQAGFEEATTTTNKQPTANNKYLWAVIIFMSIMIGFLIFKGFKKSS